MQKQVSKSSFKAHALEIMRGVEESGEEVVITSHGKKTLIVKSYVENEISPLDKLKGSVVAYQTPLAPVAEDEWELA